MKKALYLTLTFYFIQGIVSNLGHPVTPTLVENLGIEDYMFGVFFASMSLGLVVGGPIWGALGDNGSKKKYIVFGLLVYSAGQFFFAFTGNQYLMVLFRFISGVGASASITLLLTHLIRLVDKTERAKYIGYSLALMGLGGSLSYYIGGYMGEYFIKEVFYIQSLVTIVFAFGIFMLMKEDYQQKTVSTGKVNILDGFKSIGKLNPTLFLFLISLTFISIGAINISKFIDVYLIGLGYTTKQLGTFVMMTGWVIIASNFFLVPFIIKFKKDMVIMAFIQLISAVVIVLVFRSENVLFSLYTFFMVYVVLKAIYQPLESDYISTYAEDEKYGTIMGIRQSFFAIGMVIGPLIGGFLYNIDPLLVFDFSAGMFLLGFVLLIFVRKRMKRDYS
ncbi:MAG: MFS transporter [Candidatus Izemoplasma sp.]